MSTLLGAINAAGSALDAQRARMEVAVSNLANAESTRGADGQPYRRREVVLEAEPTEPFSGQVEAAGVRVADVIDPVQIGQRGRHRGVRPAVLRDRVIMEAKRKRADAALDCIGKQAVAQPRLRIQRVDVHRSLQLREVAETA